MGRTGALYASAQEGVAPDLIAIAKGLGGGYQPIGAVVVQRRIVEALERGSGLFQHGHTYLGHPVACAAALAVQRVIVRDGCSTRSARSARGSRGGCTSGSMRTRRWATSAAAVSSWRSSWSPTARASGRSSRR